MKKIRANADVANSLFHLMITNLKLSFKRKKIDSVVNKLKELDQSRKLILIEEIKGIREELRVKRSNFNNAEDDYVDIAINELNNSIEKHDVLLRELKAIY